MKIPITVQTKILFARKNRPHCGIMRVSIKYAIYNIKKGNMMFSLL